MSIVAVSRFSCLLYVILMFVFFFFFSSRRRHTRCLSDWSSDVCSSDLLVGLVAVPEILDAVHVVAAGVFGVGQARVALESLARVAERFVVEVHHTDVDEIGRASCRERGRVSGWVGGLKKRTSKREDADT